MADMGREERHQIVKHLRDTQALYEQQTDTPLVSKHHAEACRYLAAAIERGEHWLVR